MSTRPMSRNGRSPDGGRRRPHHRTDPGREADRLAQVLEHVPADTVVGLTPDVDGITLALRPFVPDPRCGGAALFGLAAPPEWQGVGVAVGGRFLRADDGTAWAADGRLEVLVTRAGRIRSRLAPDPGHHSAPEADAAVAGAHPGGVLVDALHRVLGRPCPGQPPPLEQLLLHAWLHAVDRIDGPPDWDDVVALHPAEPTEGDGGAVGVPDVVAATVSGAAELSWDRLRRLAARDLLAVADLAPAEAGWMDATMFGRWMVDGLTPPGVIIERVRRRGAPGVADRLRGVLAGLGLPPDGAP